MTLTVTLVPMTESDYLDWVSESVPAYAADKVCSGEWTEAESLELARRSLDSLLPQGLGTPNHYLFTISGDDGLSLGVLWIALETRAARRIAYVYDVYIEPGHRRKGYAAAAFHALEKKSGDLGFTGIALHVFGRNTAARSLYARLGFAETNVSMFKSLEVAP